MEKTKKDFLERKEYERHIISKLLIMRSRNEQLDVLCELDTIRFVHFPDYLEAIAKIVMAGESADILKLHERGFDGVKMREVTNVVSSADIYQYISGLQVDQYRNNILQMVHSSHELITQSYTLEEIEEKKAALLANLNGISIDDQSNFISIQLYKQKIQEQILSNSELEGFSWGIANLDAFTSGIVPSRVYVLGGLKKSGKTRFVIHAIRNLHEQGIPNVFLSMEMGAYENVKFLHASFTGINDLKFRSNSYLSDEEMEHFNSVNIDDKLVAIETKSGLTLSQVLQRIRRYAKQGYKVLFIDYLQRILKSKGDKDSTAEHLEKCSIQIADAARQNNIAVVLLSQLNAEAEKDVPNMGNLKGSGGIGEAADTILLLDNLYRRTKRDSDKNKFDIYIEQRYGDSGRITVWADLGSCRFGDLNREKKDLNDTTVNGKLRLKKVEQMQLI